MKNKEVTAPKIFHNTPGIYIRVNSIVVGTPTVIGTHARKVNLIRK
jgi:hypothetical protein